MAGSLNITASALNGLEQYASSLGIALLRRARSFLPSSDRDLPTADGHGQLASVTGLNTKTVYRKNGHPSQY